MSTKPKKTEVKVTKLIESWGRLAPEKVFAGLTLTQFKAKVKASLDTREEIATLESQLGSELTNRDTADVTSLFTVNQVVNSIKGDPDHGEDSALYEALGYVRKSDRKSGLKRVKKLASPPA